jgi:Carboxypeptidase regulatory-like domain
MIVFVRAVAALAGVALLLVCSQAAFAQSSTSTTTDGAGRYVLTDVPGGIYDLRISASGYGSTLNSDLAVTAGINLTLNTALELGTTKQSGLREIGSSSTSALSNLAAATTITRDNAIARVSSNIMSFTGVTSAH